MKRIPVLIASSRKTVPAFILMAAMAAAACGQRYDPESDFKASPRDGCKSAEITKYLGSKWEVRIPPRIQNLPVTGIAGGAFAGYADLISVTIPESVTFIGWGSF